MLNLKRNTICGLCYHSAQFASSQFLFFLFCYILVASQSYENLNDFSHFKIDQTLSPTDLPSHISHQTRLFSNQFLIICYIARPYISIRYLTTFLRVTSKQKGAKQLCT